ncbi:hypothetical protein QFC22_000796 [Naganishia vaughanmartiniae]|uniref:Uncharacterized protein n=1 Tax=Naganishia vaughanmartiniae TaxID=1424756 RepID=A0ACC2XKV1_9TREE|nr:hypothetical protein QFC22_000796 [Naganishia vaughanmartiniae]
MTMASKPPADLSFSVLDLLNSERNAFGLREKDYERYRHHCSSKIHRLRQITSSTHGNGKTFKKVEKVKAQDVKDVKTLHLLLFQAERALAFSQELQREITATGQNQNVSTYAIKKEQNSRLRKALAYATELYDIAQELSVAENSRLDALTLVEIATYLLHIQATASFAKSRHEDAIVKFVTRRKLLALLSDNAITSHAQALANQAMDESDPLIRFCAYKMGRKQGDISGGQSEVDAIVADFDDEAFEEGLSSYKKLVTEVKQFIDKRDAVAGGVNKQMLESVRWAGEAVEIRNAEVVRAMVKVQTALKALQSDDAKEKEEQEGVKKTAKMRVGSRGRSMKRWDNVLATLGDAEAVARRQIVDDNDSSLAGGSVLKSSSPTFIHQYILFLLLTYRIRRDLLFIDSMETPTNKSILKAISVQSIKRKTQTSKPMTSAASRKKSASKHYAKRDISDSRSKREEALKSLQAVTKLYDSIVQSVEQIGGLTIVEERENVWRGVNGFEAYVKAIKLAQMHAILIPAPSYPSAIQLTNQAGIYLVQSRSSLYPAGTDADEDPILEAIRPVQASDLDFMQTAQSDLENAGKRAWFGQVVTKPLFYDTAFNYVDFPVEALERVGGRNVEQDTRAAAAPSVVQQVAQPIAAAAQVVTETLGLPAIKSARESRQREATPGPADEEEPAEEKAQPKSAGWFGGLWGGKK